VRTKAQGVLGSVCPVQEYEEKVVMYNVHADAYAPSNPTRIESL